MWHRVFMSSLFDSNVSTELKEEATKYTNNAFVTTPGHQILEPTLSGVHPDMHLNI